MNLNSENAG